MDDLEARVRQSPDEPAPAFALCAAYIRGRDGRADALRESLGLRFPQAVAGWERLGKALLEVGRREAALDCLTRALRIEPSVSRAVLCGMMLRECGRLGEARDAFRAGTGRAGTGPAPQAGQAWFGLGLCEQDLGRLPAAAEAYRQATACQPGMVEAQIRLGRVLQSLGDLDGAKAAYGRALALRPAALRDVADALTKERTGALWLDLRRLRHDLEP